MQASALRFLDPENSNDRKYEALWALFVEARPCWRRRAGSATQWKRCATSRPRSPAQGAPFFLPDRRGKPKLLPSPDHDGRIAALRKPENRSAADIAERLFAKEKLPVSEATVARVLNSPNLSETVSNVLPPGTLFRPLVRASAGIRITEHEIIVSFSRKAHNPCLLPQDTPKGPHTSGGSRSEPFVRDPTEARLSPRCLQLGIEASTAHTSIQANEIGIIYLA